MINKNLCSFKILSNFPNSNLTINVCIICKSCVSCVNKKLRKIKFLLCVKNTNMENNLLDSWVYNTGHLNQSQ